MDKEKIKNFYKNKIKLINKYNKFYYDKNNPLVDDKIYDELKNEIIALEKENIFLNSDNSPSKSIGYKPSKNFKKVLHKAPMLSLSNAFYEEDLLNFEKKILNYLNQQSESFIQYTVEPKIDGISASLTYINGKFTTGLSRGDGKVGEDITANLKTIKDIPNYITAKDFPNNIDIRGEIFIQNSDFKYLKGNFANPRNAASGSLRQKNPEETKKIPLKFIAYTFGYVDQLNIDNQFIFLQKLKEWGFKTNPQNKLISGIKNLMKIYYE